ncbi:hypothetical protein [Mycobacteroides abscessus]|uniref:Uncharacterized protein n=1 Tax=Mycobacteroides abscessus MAB_091912_2446 TaxID=1335414 RepID=A0A829M872_9MYCO|nr:hypothetical protein [Mycobacteroides abscessus]ESV58926.1 hypothetical protein L830_4778 [Mycobacteroides abscessus MAB_082312_2258]ESV62310.1 hypothetical protein L833_4715 [Mycobacteroides abscessus MAB_091912_2446]AWG55557.1 hypothetical protein DDT53_15900 [Mycobacteroides abscessus]AWG60338.1 hypothetical protein DDT47_15820 [Mycobacteroides abscessus]AWG68780.1 hypothetical protein DDT49_08515 [Mycobacteroides abscessus]
MKQSIARVLRRLADRFDPPARCVINIENINDKPVTDAMRRAVEAQYAAAGKAGGEKFSRRMM